MSPKHAEPRHISRTYTSGAQRGIRAPLSTNPNSQYYPKDPELTRLLEHVLSIAKKKRFPSRMPSLSDLSKELPSVAKPELAPESFKLIARTGFERTSKIGAAGELYVWALVSSICPEISRTAWKSNMRNWAKQHPTLADLPDYCGGETADLDFFDNSGAFTKLLIQSGYLDRGVWSGPKPRYLVEVKASLTDQSKEFYVSKDQYDMMEKYRHPTASSVKRPTIYMIARVLNLQHCDIDLQLYINPASEPRLRFRQVWAVEVVQN